jgi:ubiquinone/menaquinone biosynthesis C-methylase UbiE
MIRCLKASPAIILAILVSCDFSLESRQTFDLSAFDPSGTILDLGGGGAGVIGRLADNSVIAVDISREELEDAPRGPLKIVMDASDLKFVDESFETVTSFCTLMYIDEKLHEKTFEEVRRVLKPGGSFYIWDVAVPRKVDGSKEKVLFPVSVEVSGKHVTTAYGVRRREMDLDLDYYIALAEKSGFDVTVREPEDQSFYLVLEKPDEVAESVEEVGHHHHDSPPEDELLFYDEQTVVVEDFEASDYILDIGGGGEGIIGMLKSEQVVAIDINKRELQGAPPGPMKIVMDGTDLQFLDQSFEVVTSFFTLMYIPGESHEKVFREAHRVLRPGGRFMIWDVVLPTAPDEQKRLAIFPLRVELPNEAIQTGYGVRFAEVLQDLSYYVDLAETTGFRVVDKRTKEQNLFLELAKR